MNGCNDKCIDVNVGLFYVKLRDGDPSKHETLIQCWRDTGPASKTVGQHFPNTGLMRRVHQGQTQCC